MTSLNKKERNLIPREKWNRLIGYTPIGIQKEIVEDDSLIRVFCGGRRSGKTLLWSHDDARVLLSGPYRVWIVAPSHELVERCWRVIANDLWRSKNKEIRNYCKPLHINESPGLRRVEFRNGAVLVGLSAQNPDKSLLGEGVDRLHITEAARIPRIVYEQYLLPTTLDFSAITVLDSTPRGDNWFRELYDKGQDKSQSTIRSWKMPSWQNSSIFPDGKDDPKIKHIKENQSPAYYDQEIEALFTTFQGRLCPLFDKDIHGYYHQEPIGRPKDIYAGCDWGYSHPNAITVGGVDNKGRAIVLDEFVCTETLLQDIAKEAVKLKEKYKIKAFFCGHDNPEGIEVFNDFGLNASIANNNRKAGINTLNTFIKIEKDPYFPDRIHRRFNISKTNCPETVKALEIAHYKKIKGEQSDEFDDDHLDPVDSLRYLFLSIQKQLDPDKIGDIDYLLGEE